MNRFARDFWGCFLTVVGLAAFLGIFVFGHFPVLGTVYCLCIYWACKILHLPAR